MMKFQWRGKCELKHIAKNLLKITPFYPRHIGDYTRNLYFWKCIKKLPVKNFTYVLDAGFGGGEYAKKLAIKYHHSKIDACDIKKHESWSDKQRNVNFKQRYLLKLEDENYYYFWLSIDVLEHIPENNKVLENIYKALKVGGYFYLHTPTKDERRIFPEGFFREFDDWTKEEHIGEMYKLEGLKDVMSSIGFEIIEARETFCFC